MPSSSVLLRIRRKVPEALDDRVERRVVEESEAACYLERADASGAIVQGGDLRAVEFGRGGEIRTYMRIIRDQFLHRNRPLHNSAASYLGTCYYRSKGSTISPWRGRES